MSELVTITVADRIATVCFGRPDKGNLLSIPMFEAIGDAAGKVILDSVARE